MRKSIFNLFCETGGTIALGAKEFNDSKKYTDLGADIAHTCHQSYDRTGDCYEMITKSFFCN